MNILKRIYLDFGTDAETVTVYAKQYDKKTRFIEINPLDVWEDIVLESGIIARLQLTKPDGTTVINDCKIKDGKIYAELTEQILMVAGTVTAEIALYKGEELLSSTKFYIDVEESAYDVNRPISSDEYNALTKALQDVASLKEPATTEKLGVIKVGEGLEITPDGTLSAAGGGGGVDKEYVDKQDEATLSSAKAYTDTELMRPQHSTMVVSAYTEGIGFKADHTPTEIKRHRDGGGLVLLNFDAPDGTGEQSYRLETVKPDESGNLKAYFRRPLVDVENDSVSRIVITIDKNENVEKIEDKLIVATKEEINNIAFAICDDEAAPNVETENLWYIPKSNPKPYLSEGLTVTVRWTNGREDGLGYDIKLIWGEQGGADNEVLLENASVIGSPSRCNIAVNGNVTYQLIKRNDRFRWEYVSGDLLFSQYSSDTNAELAEKVVPNLKSYISGEEIYLQLDKGNTAKTMSLINEDGVSLPVYGNGTKTETGNVGAGYILHLVNAGNYWQIVNNDKSEKKPFKLIKTITTDETTGQKVTEAVNLKKAYVIINNASKDKALQIRASLYDEKELILYLPTKAILVGQELYITPIYENNMLFPAYSVGKRADDRPLQMRVKPKNYNKITKIEILATDINFPVGSTIEIWGEEI